MVDERPRLHGWKPEPYRWTWTDYARATLYLAAIAIILTVFPIR